ncbi:MAG: LemA family protein [Kangiellaceae bacterium]|nr:LemA family protein [Kangiellaceae bacterium]
MMEFIYRTLWLAAAVISAIGGLWLAEQGYSEIKQIQQMQQVPLSKINTLLPGIVKTEGFVEPGETINSHYFKRPSVYYKFREEVEKRDSDGNYYWSTVDEFESFIPFVLKDQTAKVTIDPSIRSSQFYFSTALSQQTEVGNRRYSEWRVEPGDHLFVFGQYQQDPKNQLGVISFPKYDSLQFTISSRGEQYEKQTAGNWLIIKIAGGLSLVAVAVFFLGQAFAVHRVLIFLSGLTIVTVGLMIYLGVNLLKNDLTLSQQRLNEYRAAAKNEIWRQVEQTVDWSGMSQAIDNANQLRPERDRLRDIILNVAVSEELLRQAHSEWPLSVIKGFLLNETYPVLQSLNPTQIDQVITQVAAQQRETRTNGLGYILLFISFAVAFGFSWFGFLKVKIKRFIENIPTESISAVAFGLTEIKGILKPTEPDKLLESPLTRSQCTWFDYRVEEKQGSGKDAKWVTIEKSSQRIPMMCQDDSGEMLIMPNRASISSQHSVTHRRGRYRYSENSLRLGDELYVLGSAEIVSQNNKSFLAIKRSEQSVPFLLSNYSEQQLMIRKARLGMACLAMAFTSLLFGSLYLLGINGSFSPQDYLLIGLLTPGYMTLFMLLLHYNDLIFLFHRTNRNWSNIEVVLQKRFNLLKQLEKIVKKFFQHEQELLSEISKLRKSAIDNSSDVYFNKQFDQLEQRSKLLIEAHPDLKSNDLVNNFFEKVTEIENHLALLREGYNKAVEIYNTRIDSFPDLYLARVAKLTKRQYYRYTPN